MWPSRNHSSHVLITYGFVPWDADPIPQFYVGPMTQAWLSRAHRCRQLEQGQAPAPLGQSGSFSWFDRKVLGEWWSLSLRLWAWLIWAYSYWWPSFQHSGKNPLPEIDVHIEESRAEMENVRKIASNIIRGPGSSSGWTQKKLLFSLN